PESLALMPVFTSTSGVHLNLHSLPTRRSSDLHAAEDRARGAEEGNRRGVEGAARQARQGAGRPRGGIRPADRCLAGREGQAGRRSEEHTSELQSRENLVCRLLLEKKKKKEHHT